MHAIGRETPRCCSYALKALLYQPDQVKRSTTNSASKLLLKQKGSVGFRIGNGSFISSSSVSSFQAPGCKAQANFSTTTKTKSSLHKFKVSCGNQDSPEQQVRDALSGVFGKKRNGLSLLYQKKAKLPPVKKAL